MSVPAVATALSVAQSAGQTDAITTATAKASAQAAAANTEAAGEALAFVAIESVSQGVTDTFAASQVSTNVGWTCLLLLLLHSLTQTLNALVLPHTACSMVASADLTTSCYSKA